MGFVYRNVISNQCPCLFNPAAGGLSVDLKVTQPINKQEVKGDDSKEGY